MNNPPPRKRFQIHLSTAIVMMFVTGALIWANMSKGTLKTHFHGVHAKYQTYGWPNPAPFYIIEYHGLETLKVVPFYFAYKMVPNILTGLVILLVAYFLCEWLIRRAARN